MLPKTAVNEKKPKKAKKSRLFLKKAKKNQKKPVVRLFLKKAGPRTNPAISGWFLKFPSRHQLPQ